MAVSPQVPRKAVTARIRGRVQGVWFRAWTVEQAGRHGVSGWVRNRSDGSVEALFAGPSDAVEAMVEACRRGPPAAQVTDLEVAPAEDPGDVPFRQLPTL